MIAKVRRLLQLLDPPPSRLDDGLRQGMFGTLLQGARQAQQLPLGNSGRGHDVGDHGPSRRHGARLVEDHGGQPVGLLEGAGVLEKDARFGTPARPDHDGGGRGQAHGTGAGDDQDGHHADQGGHQLARQYIPDDERAQGDEDHGGDEDGRHPVDDPLDRGLAGLGLLDQADDLGQDRGLADRFRTDPDESFEVHRPSDQGIARDFADRETFARDHAFVQTGPSVQNHPVDGDPLSRAQDDHVADPNLLDGDFTLRSVAEQARRPRPEPQQALDRFARPSPRTRFQELARYDEGDDRGRGLEVDMSRSQTQQDDDGVEVRHRRPQRHQDVHVRRRVAQRLPSADVVLPPHVELDRCRQRPEAPVDPGCVGPGAQDSEVPGHAQDDQGHRQKRSHGQVAHLAVDLGLTGLPLGVEARFRTGLDDAVAHALDLPNDVGMRQLVGAEVHGRTLRRQVDRDLHHTVQSSEPLLERQDAIGTGHPRDGQMFRLD